MLAALAAVTLLVVGGYFATVQNVWIDESTQLLGSRLPLPRLFGWLAGAFEPLGVPGDRMPPASYLIDWACGRTVCTGETGFRLLHLAAAAAGVAVVGWLAARRYGIVAGAVAGLLLALLPQTILVGVEIRAYPFFFALTAVQLLLLHWLFDTPEIAPGRLAAFTLVGLIAVYTHFFGLVSSSALFGGLLLARARSRRTAASILVAWAILLVGAIGLAPFVGGARTISKAQEVVPVDSGAIAFYLSHIVGSAPMLLMPAIAILFFAGFAALLLAAAIRIGREMPRGWLRRPLPAGAAVVIAAAAGTIVTILAAFPIHGFNPMKPSYSIWLLPLLALLAGIGAARGRVAAGIAVVTLLALLPIDAGFLVHAGMFVHGPERAIAARIGADPRDTAILYTRPDWAYAYFPLVYRYGDRLAQYAVDGQGRARPIGAGGNPDLPPVPAVMLMRYRHLLLAGVTPRTGGDLRRAIAGTIDPAFASTPSAAGLAIDPARWRETDAIVQPGLYWLQLTRLEKMP